ncbi:FMN-binding glutamate synthase family protein [Bacillus salacetis]|uniref:FMN-binding glutamate synthase family protein n=1 Tax=Bacillus salacetis TaxID=2315464 RepID=UPI003BA070D4
MLDKMLMKMMEPMMDNRMEDMLTKPYPKNLFAMTTMMEKLTPTAVVEAGMRAESGEPLTRPIGSPNVLSPWNDLLLNPKQLFELPSKDYKTISSETVIGPKAVRPLKLSMPIMITGMSLGGSLSKPMKTALAKGATMAGTSTNTGESAVTPYERENAELLIGQYNRGGWLNTPEQLEQVDAIEVQFGQGAFGGAITDETDSSEVTEELKDIWNLQEGEDAVINSRFPNTESPSDIVSLIKKLKTNYEVPVGVKIAASDYVEYELEIVTEANADFITIDGSEGGTSSAPPTLQDTVGLPTLQGLVRTVDWLEKNNKRGDLSVIIAGGLKTPAHFLKALALGADAVYIGSIALMAAMQSQMTKALPQDPPPQIAMYSGELKDELNVEEAAKHLNNFLISSVTEMKMAAQSLGKTALRDLNRCDLVTVSDRLAGFANIRSAYDHR